MAFNSIEYLVFLLIVVLGYQVLPKNFRFTWLLLGSYYFYAQWNDKYLFLIIFSTFLDYICARKVENSQRTKNFWLGISMFGNLSMLFFFKYYGFFTESAQRLSEALGRPIYFPILELILPVGISFYTLQTMSYTIDVYRGKIRSEHNFLKFAVYVANFPQLVAGPIERASDILPQMEKRYRLNPNDLISGICLITWGIFKKVVIADRLSWYVQWAFHEAGDIGNIGFLFAGILANILIYADFSAYADIAIGSARLFGFKLKANFNFPLFSSSMPDFWKRWHISLHTWFLDYVYYPIGGGRVRWSKLMLNITIVFLLSGLWHGAAWNFVFWSLFHLSLVLVHVHVLKFWRYMGWAMLDDPFSRFIRILMVHLQRALSMYFFFIPDLEPTFRILKNFIFEPWSFSISQFFPFQNFLLFLVLFGAVVLMVGEYLHIRKSWEQRLGNQSRIVRWSCYYILVFVIMALGVETNNPFIYFQF